MKSKSTSQTVLSALRNGPMREPAHAWLFEVRNGTGYGRQPRYADALVVSVYPSRGIWLAGIEVKVFRNDWLRELDDPKKSSDIQRFCDFWWVAAAKGVVEAAEVPQTWGHYELNGKKVRVAKQAPKLEPEAYTREFLASVLRNDGERQSRLRQSGRDEAHEAASAQYDEAKFDELQRKLAECESERYRLENKARYAEQDAASLKQTIAVFERSAGLEATGLAMYRGGNYGPKQLGEQFKAACLLSQMPPAALAERFQEVANALKRIAELTAQETGT
jgi:hypothetical protein